MSKMLWGVRAWLVLAILVVACRRATGPVRIGVVIPAPYGLVGLLAADEVNAAGGVRGRPLAIVLDTSTQTTDVTDFEIRQARSMVRRGRPVGVVGHGASRWSLLAAQVYNEERVVQVEPMGTSRLLGRAGPWTFTLAPNDSVEGAFVARFLRERLGTRSVVLFYENDEYGMGLRDGVRSALASSGVRILRELRYDLLSDLSTLVDAAVQGGAPDVVVVAGYAVPTGAIARRLRALRLRCPVVAGDGAGQLNDLLPAVGPAAAGIYVVSFWVPGGSADTAGQRFARAFERRFSRRPTASDAMIYDAVRVLAAAVGAVGDAPEAVRRHLLELGRSRARYRGLTGEIGFGEGAGRPRLTMGVLRGDSMVAVEPVFP